MDKEMELKIKVLKKQFFSASFCEKCDHTGYSFFIDADGEVNRKKCICRERMEIQEKIDKNLGVSRIPKLYWDVSFRNYRNGGTTDEERKINDKSMALLYQYRDELANNLDKGVGLFIQGPYGTGKTLLGCCLAKEAIGRDFSVRFYKLSEIVDVILNRDSDYVNEEDRIKAIYDFKNCDFLLIDDADKIYHDKNELHMNLFEDLLRGRVQDMKPCWITANIQLSKVDKSFNGAIRSLLFGQSIQITFVGEDFRQIMHRERKNGN